MGCQICSKDEVDHVEVNIETSEHENEILRKAYTRAHFHHEGIKRNVRSFIQKSFYDNMNMLPQDTECFSESELKEVYSVRENVYGGQMTSAAIFFVIDDSLIEFSGTIIRNSLLAIFYDFQRYFVNLYSEKNGRAVFYKVLYNTTSIFQPTRYEIQSNFDPDIKFANKNKVLLERELGGTLNALNFITELYETKEKENFESVFIFHYHNSINDDLLGETDLNLRNLENLKYELLLFGDREDFLRKLDQEINYDVIKVSVD